MSDLDYAGAILVIGADPLHEMPILDLRIRKAVRRNGAKLLVASERPTALDGGAHEAIRYAPGDAARFLAALNGALAGEDEKGPHAKEAQAVAEQMRSVQDPIIVWGERLWRSPGAVAALRDVARALDMHQRIGPGLLEVPEESNARGLREVGLLPGAGPGLAARDASRSPDEIKQGLTDHELDALLLVNADPVRTYPDGDGWRKALAGNFVVAISMFDDESTRHANIVLPGRDPRREGGNRHPPRGPPAARAPERPPPQGRAPRLAGPRRATRCSRRRPRGGQPGGGLREALSGGSVLRGDCVRGDRRPGAALAGARPGRVMGAGVRHRGRLRGC